MDANECACPLAGWCERYGRTISGRLHAICSGQSGLPEPKRQAYLAKFSGQPAPASASTAAEQAARQAAAAAQRKAAAAAERAARAPTAAELADYPPVLQLGWNFLQDWRAWRRAGKPVVAAQQRAARRALCLACDHYDSAQDRCTRCGCYLHQIKVGGVIDADALSWATKHCPLGKWPGDQAAA